MNLKFDSDRYETYIGSPFLKLTCIGENLNLTDIVWIKYLISNPMTQRVIFSDNDYMLYEHNNNDESQQRAVQSYFQHKGSSETTHKSLKYFVESTPNFNGSINVSLILFNIQESDIFYGYECVCNIYKRCSSSNHAKANTTLIAIKVTTSKAKIIEHIFQF